MLRITPPSSGGTLPGGWLDSQSRSHCAITEKRFGATCAGGAPSDQDGGTGAAKLLGQPVPPSTTVDRSLCSPAPNRSTWLTHTASRGGHHHESRKPAIRSDGCTQSLYPALSNLLAISATLAHDAAQAAVAVLVPRSRSCAHAISVASG